MARTKPSTVPTTKRLSVQRSDTHRDKEKGRITKFTKKKPTKKVIRANNMRNNSKSEYKPCRQKKDTTKHTMDDGSDISNDDFEKISSDESCGSGNDIMGWDYRGGGSHEEAKTNKCGLMSLVKSRLCKPRISKFKSKSKKGGEKSHLSKSQDLIGTNASKIVTS